MDMCIINKIKHDNVHFLCRYLLTYFLGWGARGPITAFRDRLKTALSFDTFADASDQMSIPIYTEFENILKDLIVDSCQDQSRKLKV